MNPIVLHRRRPDEGSQLDRGGARPGRARRPRRHHEAILGRRSGAEQSRDQRQRRAPHPRGLRRSRAAACGGSTWRFGSLRVGIDGRAFTSPAARCSSLRHGTCPRAASLGEELEIVALGGADSSALPRGIGHVAEPPHPPTNLGWTLIGLPRAAARGRGRSHSCARLYRAVLVASAGRAHHPRRQLRASSRVVSLPPRLDAPGLLSPQRARRGADRDRLDLLRAGNRGGIRHSARSHHGRAARRRRWFRARRSRRRPACLPRA